MYGKFWSLWTFRHNDGDNCEWMWQKIPRDHPVQFRLPKIFETCFEFNIIVDHIGTSPDKWVFKKLKPGYILRQGSQGAVSCIGLIKTLDFSLPCAANLILTSHYNGAEEELQKSASLDRTIFGTDLYLGGFPTAWYKVNPVLLLREGFKKKGPFS